uniref:Secreted peptide n=1 Tax=Anopheles braziliensis TaxID=58242 RepID=A0A2M3Z245_9DIPT
MIGKRLDVLLLLTACLIVIVTDASPVPDSNDVATVEQKDTPPPTGPGGGSPDLPDRCCPRIVRSIDPSGSPDRCCLGAIKPIVLTAKPRYKYVVVPPISIT